MTLPVDELGHPPFTAAQAKVMAALAAAEGPLPTGQTTAAGVVSGKAAGSLERLGMVRHGHDPNGVWVANLTVKGLERMGLDRPPDAHLPHVEAGLPDVEDAVPDPRGDPLEFY